MTASPTEARRALRTDLRARRAALAPRARARESAMQLRTLARSPWLRPGTWVALYVAHGSEAPTAALLALARARGCHACLPRIADRRAARMQLVRWNGAPLVRGAFGLRAPRGGSVAPPQRLALLLVPLVGFDARGTRLGMGGGFYDRLLAFRRARRGAPLVIGLAFEAQRSPVPLPRAAHDVPLDAVLTGRGLHWFTY